MLDTNTIHLRIAIGAKSFLTDLFGERLKENGEGRYRVGKHGSLALSITNDVVVFYDHERGEGGDIIDLVAREKEVTTAEALKFCARWAGIEDGATLKGSSVGDCLQTRQEPTGPVMPKDSTAGTIAQWCAVAQARNISTIAPATAASHLATLRFGSVCGFPSWILTDQRRIIAEARRMDGQKYPAFGSLGERKAHTLKNSVKSWPVGLMIPQWSTRDFRAILAVEGAPDYLAAMHFTLRAKADCLPVAFLGAGTAGEIHPDALHCFRNRRVRFYPHADGAGGRAVEKWANQLAAVGANVDAFKFDGLRKADGSPVKDLNDCTSIHPDDANQLAEMLP